MKYDSEKFEDLLNSNIQSYHQKILDKIVKLDSNSYKKLILRQYPSSDNDKEITIERLKNSFNRVRKEKIIFKPIENLNNLLSDPYLSQGIKHPVYSNEASKPISYEDINNFPLWNFKTINENIDIFWSTKGHLLSYSNLLEMEVYEDVILTYENRLRLMGHDNFVIKDNWMQFINSAIQLGFTNFKHVPKHKMGRSIVLFEEETGDNFKLQLSYSDKELKRKLKENLNLTDYIAVSLKCIIINNGKKSEHNIPLGSIVDPCLCIGIPRFEGVLSSLFMISGSDAEFAKKFLVSILEKDGLEYAFYPETLKIWLKKYAIMYYDLLNFTTIDYLTYLKENAVKCLSE
ncbi:MAG TPA: hypothetical protein VGF79_11745 [Bacteroidia bacterium]